MTDLPDLKIKALVSFPSNALGGTGIEVDKTNGNYIIGLDYSEFAFSGTLPPNTNTLVWDPVTDTYILVPPSAVGGITDAPSDSQTYGRNNAAWVEVASPTPATATPIVAGVGTVGVSLKYAREDHVHPAGAAGSGDVVGPASSVADNIATYNGATGKIIKDGGATIASLATTASVSTEIAAKAVRYDTAQVLTEVQDAQARSNIYAAPFDAMAQNNVAINAAMEISQQNGTTAINGAHGVYGIDGWVFIRTGTSVTPWQQITSTITGFKNSLKISVTTAQATIGADVVAIAHRIEGLRFARARWGFPDAKPVSVGFKAKFPVAGTYGVSIFNSTVAVVM